MKEAQTEEQSIPRYEFRTFGQSFEHAAYRMARLSEPVPEDMWERSTDEIYIVSSANDTYNTKIRAGKLEMKQLVKTVDGLEQWRPTLESEFPLSIELMTNEIVPAFQVHPTVLSKEEYSVTEFLEWAHQNPQLRVISIHKKRFGYRVNNTICETGEVIVNGARVMTISCESTNAADVRKTIRDIYLTETENINYLQMIKRVTGLTIKPLAN